MKIQITDHSRCMRQNRENMGRFLLKLSLCVAMVIHRTSSEYTYGGDPAYDTDPSGTCTSTQQCQQLSQLMTSSNAQLSSDISQLASAVTQLTSALSQLESDVAELKRESSCPLLIHKNANGGSSSFGRSWEEYKVGFSASDGSFWMGNDKLHQLTTNGNYKLGIDLQSYTTSEWYWAEYSTFTVSSEADGYKLTVGGYTGNAGFDAMAYHNGMKFSTYDRDNDGNDSGNCASTADSFGGYWFNDCSEACLTCWGIHFQWKQLPAGAWRLKTGSMWLVCA